jgi:hypothetical protein
VRITRHNLTSTFSTTLAKYASSFLIARLDIDTFADYRQHLSFTDRTVPEAAPPTTKSVKLGKCILENLGTPLDYGG